MIEVFMLSESSHPTEQDYPIGVAVETEEAAIAWVNIKFDCRYYTKLIVLEKYTR